MTVPVDAKGKPLVKVTNGARETIPTVPFGNITIGPAQVEMYVENTPEAINNGLRECLSRAEIILGEERDNILAKIKAAGIK